MADESKTSIVFSRHAAEQIRDTVRTVQGQSPAWRSGKRPVRYKETFAAYGPANGESLLEAWCTVGRWFMDGVVYYNETDDDLSVEVEGGTEEEPHILYARLCDGVIELVEYAEDDELPDTVEGEDAYYFPVGKVWLSGEGEEEVALTIRTWYGGDIVFTVASDSVNFSFKFSKTSDTGGTISHGKVLLAGVSKTIAGWTNHSTGADLVLSNVTATTYYYIAVEFAAGTATWGSSTSAFPVSDDDTEIVEIVTITCANSKITAATKQHQCGHVRIPSNV